ncbi:aspartate kinase [Candidatus Woesearchaeota archaeon]|nr:aspartate kinase [Candidatus Woesearchaeota archaeon]
MENLIVCKFGGSSIISKADVERIRKISDDDSARKILVVSAPGKRNNNDKKVTDLLIALAEDTRACIDDLETRTRANEIITRYQALTSKTLAYIEEELQQRIKLGLPSDAYLDSVKAFGEEACAKVLAEALNAEYVDPQELFLVTPDFSGAAILPPSEKMIQRRLKGIEKLCVVPGFYGYTENGTIATFSRGGSDLTGAYIAAALDARMYENFSDIPGILAADPRIVRNPKKIEKLTFKEMRDLAYLGSKLHPEAISPCAKKGIPIHIRETAGYPARGTYVVQERMSDPNQPIVGVAYQGGFCSFDILKFGVNEEVGVLRRILQVFEDKNISVEYVPSAIDDISVIVRDDELKKHDIGMIVGRIQSALGCGTDVNFKEHLGCLAVAGKALRGHRGISASIQSTLADAGVNIIFISQGSEERCIIYGINGSDHKKAVNAIYDKYLR